MTPTSPDLVLSAAVTFSKSTALVPGGRPQRRSWRRGEKRTRHQTPGQVVPSRARRGREHKEKSKAKQISRRSSSAASSVSPAFELLLLCCSFTPSATSTKAGARLRMPRTVSPHSSVRAGMRKRARSRAQQTEEAGAPPLPQRQSKSIPIGEASHTMS